jgi:hypothetical protein
MVADHQVRRHQGGVTHEVWLGSWALVLVARLARPQYPQRADDICAARKSAEVGQEEASRQVPPCNAVSLQPRSR